MATVKKEKSERNQDFAVGGKTHMFGEQNAGDQRPGKTSHDTGNPQGSGGGEWGKSGAKDTPPSTKADFASGGSGKMFGFAGAMPAKSGITSAR